MSSCSNFNCSSTSPGQKLRNWNAQSMHRLKKIQKHKMIEAPPMPYLCRLSSGYLQLSCE
uniref:Uncharacterized protein n=1 Tax=Arundo donax TaxID=35708 RepID=A0A0A9GZL6_ARUDO